MSDLKLMRTSKDANSRNMHSSSDSIADNDEGEIEPMVEFTDKELRDQRK